MRIKSAAVPMDVEAIKASEDFTKAFAELKAGLSSPVVTAARWSLLSHRPLPGAEERYVATYTVNLAVDSLGIMPEEYLAHDGDVTPEFDLRSLFESVLQRAPTIAWKGRVECTVQLKGGFLFDVSVRLPDDSKGSWEVAIDEPPVGTHVRTVEELERLARQRRRITVSGVYDTPRDMPDGDIEGRLAVVTEALLDTPNEIERGWPLRLNVTRFEWEE